MKIITNNGIRVEKTSNCGGMYSGADSSIGPTIGAANKPVKKGVFGGYFKKEARLARQAARRAKKNARPLQKVGAWFHDLIPHVTKTDGGYMKTNPDGSTTPVDPANLVQLDPAKYKGLTLGPDGKLVFDKMDLGGKPLAILNDNGVAKAAIKYAQHEVSEAQGPDGNIAIYKNDDTEDASKPENKKDEPISLTAKVLIGLGGLAVLGGIVYLASRKKA